MARLHRDILLGWPIKIPREVWIFSKSQVYVFAAYLLTMAALRVPQLWLEAHGGVYEVAYYSAAARLVEPLAFIPWAFMSPMFVRYTAQDFGPKAIALRRRMLFLGMSTGFVLAGLLTLGSEPLVQVLYGSEFALGAHVLRVLSWTLLPQFVLLALVRIAVHEGRTRWLAAHGITQLGMLLVMLYLNQAAKTQDAVTVAYIVVAAAFVSVLLLFVAQMRRPPRTSD
jgi:O-antigen/teichoic acid export membrane protein